VVSEEKVAEEGGGGQGLDCKLLPPCSHPNEIRVFDNLITGFVRAGLPLMVFGPGWINPYGSFTGWWCQICGAGELELVDILSGIDGAA
jgi:hypothetical protein